MNNFWYSKVHIIWSMGFNDTHWNANLLAHLLKRNSFGFYIHPQLCNCLPMFHFSYLKKKRSEKHQVWLNEVANEREKKTILISYTNLHFLCYEKFLAIQMTATFYFFILSVWYSWRHKKLMCGICEETHFFFMPIISTVRRYNVTKRM